MVSLLHVVKWRLGLEAPETWTRRDEQDAMMRHATGRKRLAEIGVWEGATTCLLRSVMSPDATLYAVDPYPPGRLGISYQRIVATGSVARVRNGRVVWVRQTAVDAGSSPLINAAGPFDFVYLDAEHTYEASRAACETWLPLVAPGGIVAIHDSEPVGKENETLGSVRYTREVLKVDPRVRVLEAVHSTTIFERR